VVRVEGHDTKALAFSSDVTPRYVEADPFEGGKQAVAECWRNLTAVGAEPAGLHRQPQFRQSRTPGDHGPASSRASAKHQRPSAKPAVGARSAAPIDAVIPIVSGNVSLYNETNGDISSAVSPSCPRLDLSSSHRPAGRRSLIHIARHP
jgi:phosphoribosylformylglycinamidine (FGAM) synthase-like enzyme